LTTPSEAASISNSMLAALRDQRRALLHRLFGMLSRA
jgi:hypothetical protein